MKEDKKYQLDWYNELSEVFMGRGYFPEGEDIYSRIDSISGVVTKYFGEEIGNKAKEFIVEGCYVLPSPSWSNVGTGRGAGISCFNTHFGDSVASITRGVAEIALQCKIGGGTSGYYEMRAAGSPISTGGESMGPLHFMEWTAKTKETISQGSTRRGEHAVFLDVYHPDIMEFLNINGEGSKLQRLPFGVCIPDKFYENLKNYGQKEMEIQAAILDSRNRTGFPYIFNTDVVNRNTADVYKDLGLKIKSTNMCTEILEPSTEDESFVCNLIGMRLTKYHTWKNTDAVRIAVYIADAILQEFIDLYKGVWGLERSVKFAENHRAIAIGASGYHSLLQSLMIPFESWEAKSLNIEIFKHISEKSIEASKEMFTKYGASEMMTPYGRRHSVLQAVAPNTSSSFIMNQESQSIEPYVSNYYIKKSAKVKHAVKNPYLKALLIEKEKDTSAVWESILKNEGSVAHLDFLSDYEKLVFRTFIEISQMEIIIQASSRQKYIDQGQSLNLMIHPSVPTKEVNALMLKAHELEIKTLYYQLGQNASAQFAKSLSCEVCSG
jgi:ribonucleoside-diphosphate reductase alpha chain